MPSFGYSQRRCPSRITSSTSQYPNGIRYGASSLYVLAHIWSHRGILKLGDLGIRGKRLNAGPEIKDRVLNIAYLCPAVRSKQY